MKYTKKVQIDEIIGRYDTIIAWGVGPLFYMNYKKYYFRLDFIIDGTGQKSGSYYNDIPIKGEESLENLQGKSLIIIYAIYEKQILEQINKYNSENIDIIIYPLLEIELESDNLVTIYAKSSEDMLLLMLTRQLNMDTVQYLEIGVCHPIMRNNTYLLYDQFSGIENYRGVLVEANPLCWELIDEYRGRDKLIRKGIGRGGVMPFYVFPNLLGHSTFVEELAEKNIKNGQEHKTIEVETDSINNIIKDNFDRTPDILAIDAEGLDYDILMDWDWRKYPFKIVMAETTAEGENSIEALMKERGFKMYAKTIENVIWVREDQELHI